MERPQVQAFSGRRKSQGCGFPPGVSRKKGSLADTLILAQWAQHQSSDWENCEIIKGHCFKPLRVWYLVTVVIGTSSTKCTWAMETLRNGTKALVKILCITDNRKPIRTNNTRNVLAGITKKARLDPMPECNYPVAKPKSRAPPMPLQTRGKSESSGSPSGCQMLLDRRKKEQILRHDKQGIFSFLLSYLVKGRPCTWPTPNTWRQGWKKMVDLGTHIFQMIDCLFFTICSYLHST